MQAASLPSHSIAEEIDLDWWKEFPKVPRIGDKQTGTSYFRLRAHFTSVLLPGQEGTMELRMDSLISIKNLKLTDPNLPSQPVHHMVLPILGNSHFSATQIKSHLTPLFFFYAPHSMGEEILSLSQNVLRIFLCLTIFTVIAKPLFFCLFVL